MPLVVFVAISGMGAVFLIVFIAQLCRHEHREPAAWSRTEGRGGRAMRGAALDIHMVSKVAPKRDAFGSVLVLRRTIACGEPNRPTHIPGKRMPAEMRETWQ